jgi:hypothetical protein
VLRTFKEIFATLRKDHRKMIALLAQMISLSDRAQAVAALEEFKCLLHEHELIEGEALYPVLTLDVLPHDVASAHATVRHALRDLSGTATDTPEWWDGVVRLRQSVEHHIVEEETVLYGLTPETPAAAAS